MFRGKTNKKKYIMGIFCTLLAVVTAGVAVMSATQTAFAGATLPGVEKIIQGNGTENPFVILEIVPEAEDASLGFFVAGEEPVDSTGKSIKDMPSAKERERRFGAVSAGERNGLLDKLGISDAVEYSEYEEISGNGTRTVNIRGVFEETEGGDYAETDTTEQFKKITIVPEDADKPANHALGEYTLKDISNRELYRRYMSFHIAGKNDGNRYAVNLKILEDTKELPVAFYPGVSGNALVDEDDPVSGAYNHQYFVVVEDEITKENYQDYLGELIFTIEREENGEYTELGYAGILTDESGYSMLFMPGESEEETEEETETAEETEEETETVEETEEETETETETEAETEEVPETEPEEETETAEETKEEPETEEETGSETVSETVTEPENTTEVSDEEEVEKEEQEPSVEDLTVAFTTKKMQRMSIKLSELDEGIGAGIRYVVVKEADGADSGASAFFCIASVTADESADLTADESYNKVVRPDGGYTEDIIGETFYLKNDSVLPYEYMVDENGNGAGTHTFTADYTQEIYETVSYTGGYANEEWFKKYVFNLDKSEYEDMCIDVVPVTWKELIANPGLLDKADLLYFADPNNKGFVSGDAVQDKDNWIVQFDFDDEYGYTDSGVSAVGKAGTTNAAASFDGWSQYLQVSGLLNNAVTNLAVSFTMNTAKDGKNWPFFLPYDTAVKPTNLSEKYLGTVVGRNNGVYRLVAERYYGDGQTQRPVCAQAQVQENTDAAVSVFYREDSTQIYVNGQASESVASSIELSRILTDAQTKPFWIGYANWGSGEYYQGTLDDYVISNATSPEELATLLENTKNNADSIYNAVVKKVSEGLPVVLNRSLYSSEKNDMAVRKMAACLMSENISALFGNDGVDGRAVETMSLTGLESSMIKTAAFVRDNVYVYDDALLAGATNETAARETVVSGSFRDAAFYSESEIEAGFSDVVAEIKNENFYLEVAQKEERISEDVTIAAAIRHILNYGERRNVTKTTLKVLDLEPYDFEDYYPESDYVVNGPQSDAYRHKTVYNGIKSASVDNDTVSKIETDSICITDGKLDKTGWLIDNIVPQFEGNASGLDVTIMGTKEFIGKLEDINAEYDLIYLGLDTSIMNTVIEGTGQNRLKTDNTVYNDSAMNGLVYTHVGDEYPVGSARNDVDGDYRLAGNDITRDKLRELKEYIEAGYAVILSDGFLVKENGRLTVNTAKIDKSSNMYKLINETVLATDDKGEFRYYGKNVNSKSNLEAGAANYGSTKEIFNRYLGISKLTMKYTDADLPAMYNEADGVTSADYLSMDSDGVYRLRFNIELQNDAAVNLLATSYDCKLYMDLDADGRYESEEALTGLAVTDSRGNTYHVNGKGHFELRTGEKYKISREIPEGYTGFLAWKLVFEMNDRTYAGTDDMAVVRSNIVGYSAVPVNGIKPIINVLQITTHDAPTAEDDKTTLNLAETTPPSNDVPSMASLYAGVQDFDIRVTTIPSSAYVSMSDSYFGSCTTYEEYTQQFDMLVMGFTDSYQYGNGIGTDHIGNSHGRLVVQQDVIDSMLAIREFALSGRSILFTHDLNSMQIDADINEDKKSWGWYANQILRDIQGMDRYGTLQNASLIPKDDKYYYESKYDEAYLKGEAVDNAGLSNPLILDWNHKAALIGQSSSHFMTFDEIKSLYTYGENSRMASWNVATHLNYQQQKNMRDYSSYVSQVNAGQITEYPYSIDETFAATHSHPQYLQLNMDTDNRDANNNDDIVVWYTLDKNPEWCDSIFAANEKDVRNHYFIYNKGNITYTGSGDSEVLNTMERKLFVNTLVASYRTGTHAARALFKESEWETSATISSLYLPYDPAMNSGNGGFLDETLSVNLKVTNMDLRKSDEALCVKYYVDGTSGDYSIKVDGKYYKEIVPVRAYRLTVKDGAIVKVQEDAAALANNSMHQLEFSYDSLGLTAQTENIRNKNTANIYVRLGYNDMQTAGEISLPASESLTGLNIVCTQLFELK